MGYYYISVKSDCGNFFVGRESILTDNFEMVRKFCSEQDAADFVAKNHIHDRTRILFYKEIA